MRPSSTSARAAIPQRAWAWARANLNERSTRRAYELAIRAAEATGRAVEALAMRQQLAARHAPRAA